MQCCTTAVVFIGIVNIRHTNTHAFFNTQEFARESKIKTENNSIWLHVKYIIKHALAALLKLPGQDGSRDVARPIAVTCHCHVAFHASKL